MTHAKQRIIQNSCFCLHVCLLFANTFTGTRAIVDHEAPMLLYIPELGCWCARHLMMRILPYAAGQHS